MDAALRAAVVAEAVSWIGTPYHHHGRIKGVGVDCLMLLAEVFEHAGACAHVDPGDYAVQWHLHRSEELYIAGLLQYCQETDLPEPGDIALFRFGRTYSHGAIHLGGGEFVHSYIGTGVIRSSIDEYPLAGRPVKFWTLKNERE